MRGNQLNSHDFLSSVTSVLTPGNWLLHSRLLPWIEKKGMLLLGMESAVFVRIFFSLPIKRSSKVEN